ncbi:MAG: hypothetical protein R3D59_02430 [Paracoccaceae bacterium]
MTKPTTLPGALKLAEVCEATWPPASQKALGAWIIRDGKGGGNRVSAATEAWPVTDADLPIAEKAMRALDQEPLFQIREGDHKLDALLETHGYIVRDPVNLWAGATAPSPRRRSRGRRSTRCGRRSSWCATSGPMAASATPGRR